MIKRIPITFDGTDWVEEDDRRWLPSPGYFCHEELLDYVYLAPLDIYPDDWPDLVLVISSRKPSHKNFYWIEPGSPNPGNPNDVRVVLDETWTVDCYYGLWDLIPAKGCYIWLEYQ